MLGVGLGLLMFAGVALVAVNFFLLGLNPDDGGTIAQQVPTPEPGERINVLILGVDAAQSPQPGVYVPSRSDTIMVATIDPVTSEVAMVFVPRDTRVPIAGRPTEEKIAHAHAHGGIERAIDTVSKFLDIPIHYYVRLDFSGFAEIIDSIGGVQLDVEEHMYYEDPAQDLVINIPAGQQHMDGNTALHYVRYRNGSDIDRIERQKKFLRQLVQQVLSLRTVKHLGDLATSVTAHVDTNLSPTRIVSLSRVGLGISPDDVEMEMIPGSPGYRDGISYWFPDYQETEDLIERVILGIRRPENSSVSVEVLNGGGVRGAATEVADYLERLGYEVLRVENAADMGGEKYEVTRVVSRCDDELEGKLMVRALRNHFSDDQEINLYRDVSDHETEEDEVTADISVFVGADYRSTTSEGE